ncbi:ABC transporter ATP-binding protein [Halorientalis sp. IM1011]|uniref:ABC transporter ATP-binding protein n=1 Tax=Halorientalis sp. IM1011 TaxID=1932360 RepID=UPI0012F82669
MGANADTGSVERSRETRTAGRETAEADSHLFAEDLIVGYAGTDEPVVTCDRIDLPRGEITALVGPNGSGKSTLLKSLSKHLEPSDGSVVLDGESIHTYEQKELARELGFLSQEHNSPESISVEELIYHGRYPHRGFFEGVSEADREAVERAIDLTGIDHLRDDHVGSLSGGQKQLVWIAMVLAQETDVLLLDEPTTFLDLHHQLQVLEVVRSLNEREDVTVGVVLHDIEQAARFADYVVALEDGDVYDWGPPREVITEELLADVFNVDAAVTTDADVRISPKKPL